MGCRKDPRKETITTLPEQYNSLYFLSRPYTNRKVYGFLHSKWRLPPKTTTGQNTEVNELWGL